MRQRRSNAGNRLQELLADQTGLIDGDEIFAEREDDEDFDLEAEERRLEEARLKRLADEKTAENSDEDSEPELLGENDENFSDSSDDEELENDQEPADMGEKQLVQEQRREKRLQRTKERNKMFTIRQRPVDAPKPKKKRVFTSEDIVRAGGRHSERKSAMRNKQFLIDQMREAEARRAQYVPPKKKNVPKLTQKQRLEEAKKTEMRNLASLNKFLELEEDRKHQQRLAMLSRRPKMTSFIRFQSSQYDEAPKTMVTYIQYPPAPVNAVAPNTYSSSAIPGAYGPQNMPGASVQTTSEQVPPVPVTSQATSGLQPPTVTQNTNTSPQTSNNQGTTSTTAANLPTQQQNTQPERSQGSEVHNQTAPPSSQESAPQDSQKEPEKEAEKQAEKNIEQEVQLGSQNSQNSSLPVKKEAQEPTVETESLSTTGPSSTAELKSEPSTLQPISASNNTNSHSEPTKADSVLKSPAVEGPPQRKTFNFLTLHDFPQHTHFTKPVIKEIVMGPISAANNHPPPKRICPFTGRVARYLDPQTGIAYFDLATYKRINDIRQNKLGWSKELGGVFTAGVRAAKGVPKGLE